LFGQAVRGLTAGNRVFEVDFVCFVLHFKLINHARCLACFSGLAIVLTVPTTLYLIGGI